MLTKNFIKKYINKKFKYFKYIINYNLWVQIYLILIAKYLLKYKLSNKSKIFFNQKKEFVKNQN